MRGEYHGTSIGDGREASKIPVSLAANCHPVYTDPSQIVLLAGWVANVGRTDVRTVALERKNQNGAIKTQ
jgi:hypothetical protein